jgi:hypothetical protein
MKSVYQWHRAWRAAAALRWRVQIVWFFRRGSRDIEHLGSAHDDAELELLKAAARQRLAAGQAELDLRLDAAAAGGPLLTGQDGFPLMVSAFEGNKAETTTMLPVIEKFMAAHRLPDVTVVADAG